MAIATAATALAIGSAAAGLGGAALSSRANNKATRTQSQSTDKALAFERENEARRRQEYDQAQTMQRAAYEARERARLGLLQRYGVIPKGGAMPGQGTPGAMTLGALAGRPPATAAAVNPSATAAGAGLGQNWIDQQRTPAGTLATLGKWHEWGGR